MLQIRPFLKDAEIVFSEMNSVRIIRGIYNIQACNPILVVPPNAIINPKKSMIWDPNAITNPKKA
jgi:hypothetical protein